MCADRKRCGMIGTYEYGKIIKGSEKIGYRLENMLINEFNSLNFVLNLSSVTAFIGSFNMDIYKIRTVFEFINCGFALSVKVCVNIACCSSTSTLFMPAQIAIPLRRSTAEIILPFCRTCRRSCQERVLYPRPKAKLS